MMYLINRTNWLPEISVGMSKVVAPLRHAVRLVNRDGTNPLHAPDSKIRNLNQIKVGYFAYFPNAKNKSFKKKPKSFKNNVTIFLFWSTNLRLLWFEQFSVANNVLRGEIEKVHLPVFQALDIKQLITTMITPEIRSFIFNHENNSPKSCKQKKILSIF